MLGEKGYLRAEFPFCLLPLYTLCARHFFEFSPRFLYFHFQFPKTCETRVEIFEIFASIDAKMREKNLHIAVVLEPR